MNPDEILAQPVELIDKIMLMAVEYAPRLLLAIVTLLVGLYVINLLISFFNKSMERSKVEPTLRTFLNNLASVLLKAMLLISIAGTVGIPTASFVAVIGAAGLAVGLALQGSLANFAGGVLILMFKPFKVGDVIEAQGFIGVVREIQIFVTILTTGDNRRVIIPNGALSNGSLININAEPTRRVDMTFGISYDDDILKAKDLLWKLIKADERILEEPASNVFVKEHADSSVNLLVRMWVKSGDYWGVYWEMMEKVKLEFDANDITIPYPQRDIHVHQVEKAS